MRASARALVWQFTEGISARSHCGLLKSSSDVLEYFRTQSPSVQTWNDLEAFRRAWKGRLVIKGIQHPDDAVRAADAGVDGVIVSNHGGKAMDRGPAALDALPGVAQAVGDRVVVMMDSGIRRGSDVVLARCLGAQFVFAGRAPLYAVIADGEAGVRECVRLLQDEIDRTLGLLGCPDARRLDATFVRARDRGAPTMARRPAAAQFQPPPGLVKEIA